MGYRRPHDAGRNRCRMYGQRSPPTGTARSAVSRGRYRRRARHSLRVRSRRRGNLCGRTGTHRAMSAMTIVVLIAGYLGFVGFVLALLTTAKRSGEAAERQGRAVATSREALRRPQGVIRDAGFDADAA